MKKKIYSFALQHKNKIALGIFILANIFFIISAIIFDDYYPTAIVLLTLAGILVVSCISFYIYIALSYRHKNSTFNVEYKDFITYANLDIDAMKNENYKDCFKTLTKLENLHYNRFFDVNALQYNYSTLILEFKKYTETLRNKNKDYSDYIYMHLVATGNDSMNSKIIRIILLKYSNNVLTDTLDKIVNPGVYVNLFRRIKLQMKYKTIKSAPAFRTVVDEIIKFIGDNIIISRDSIFDYNLLVNEIYNVAKKEIKFNVKKSIVTIDNVCSIDDLNSIVSNDTIKNDALKNALAFTRE